MGFIFIIFLLNFHSFIVFFLYPLFVKNLTYENQICYNIREDTFTTTMDELIEGGLLSWTTC